MSAYGIQGTPILSENTKHDIVVTLLSNLQDKVDKLEKKLDFHIAKQDKLNKSFQAHSGVLPIQSSSRSNLNETSRYTRPVPQYDTLNGFNSGSNFNNSRTLGSDSSQYLSRSGRLQPSTERGRRALYKPPIGAPDVATSRSFRSASQPSQDDSSYSRSKTTRPPPVDGYIPYVNKYDVAERQPWFNNPLPIKDPNNYIPDTSIVKNMS